MDDSFLVTGNIKHFPKKPFVVTPAEMLQIIQEMKSPRTDLLSEPTARYGGGIRDARSQPGMTKKTARHDEKNRQA